MPVSGVFTSSDGKCIELHSSTLHPCELLDTLGDEPMQAFDCCNVFYPDDPSDQAFFRVAAGACISETTLPSGYKMPGGFVGRNEIWYDWFVDRRGKFAALDPNSRFLKETRSKDTTGLWRQLKIAKTSKGVHTTLVRMQEAGLVTSETKAKLIELAKDAKERLGKDGWTDECKEAFRALLVDCD